MYATFCNYPTDLVLDDVVADTVLVVNDLLMSRSIKHVIKHSLGMI